MLPLSPNGLFRSVQGEGHLLGVPMVFIRLAGCSVGCPECDTDYRVSARMDEEDIVRRVAELCGGGIDWVWITGGEPTDHDLGDLLKELKKLGTSTQICMATSGHKEVPWEGLWLSVSPHDMKTWKQRVGAELKIVPGLNGLTLRDVEAVLSQEPRPQFAHKYVCPLYDREDRLERVAECVEFLNRHPLWRMNVQGHKHWNLA